MAKHAPIHLPGLTRREFLGAAAAGAGALALAPRLLQGAPHVARDVQPNIVYIMCDQMNLDAMSLLGETHARTPNLDRLAQRGTLFMESHSPNPVCSPARSSMLTGRMPVETGVVTNDLAIHPSIPNLGQWFSQAGYDTAYCGKWHLPAGWPASLPGFTVLPVGAAQGDLVDNAISRTCEAFVRARASATPYLLVASFMQPHDICYWAIMNQQLVPGDLPFPHLAGALPPLPPNHGIRPVGPAPVSGPGYVGFPTDEQWRYYLWIYRRMVEMLDADVGRLLTAIEESPQADNTIVVFTSDHGEGAGRHNNVQKWHPYDESMKVPLIVSAPGRLQEDVIDSTHLVSGVDTMATLCDLAGIAAPAIHHGRSWRPLLEATPTQWRDSVVCEWQQQGRIVRTAQWKYVKYGNDPVEQLFDMQADPWETVNLHDQPQLASVLADHRAILADWNAQMVIPS